MTEYEIKCNQSWAWYSAYITDYAPDKKKFFVRFPDDWKEAYWEDPSNVRPLPDPIDLNAWIPRRGEEAECQAKAEENEPYGWWGCIIQNVQNGVYSVKFDGWDEMHNEKLEKSLLRPKNNKKPLNARDLARESIQVDQKLIDWVKSKPKDLEQLRKRPRLIHLGYDENAKSLIIVAPKRIIEQCTQLIRLHFNKQKNLMEHELKTKNIEAKLAQRKKIEENALKATFRIHPFLTGHVLGRKRENLKQLKQNIPDIINVNVENGQCTISASTQYALDSALDQLHVVARKVLIPKTEMGYIIGKNGANIQELRKSVDVSRIVTNQNWPQEFDKMKQRLTEREQSKIKQQMQHQKNRQQQQQQQISSRNAAAAARSGKQPPPASAQVQTNDNEIQGDEEEEDILVPEITNVNPNDLFDEKEGDIIDLSNHILEKEKDALIIIGRKSKVDLCISMIELTLSYLKKINETRFKIDKLRMDLSKLRGYPEQPNYYNQSLQQPPLQSQGPLLSNVDDQKEEKTSVHAPITSDKNKNKNKSNTQEKKTTNTTKTVNNNNTNNKNKNIKSKDKTKEKEKLEKDPTSSMEVKESKSKRRRNKKKNQPSTSNNNIHSTNEETLQHEEDQEEEEDNKNVENDDINNNNNTNEHEPEEEVHEDEEDSNHEEAEEEEEEQVETQIQDENNDENINNMQETDKKEEGEDLNHEMNNKIINHEEQEEQDVDENQGDVVKKKNKRRRRKGGKNVGGNDVNQE